MRALAIVLMIALLCGCGVGAAADVEEPAFSKYRSEFIGLFDTATAIIAYAESEEAFDRFVDVIHSRMTQLNNLYDIYNAYDGINNLYTVNQNAGIAPVAVDQEIIDLLLFAVEGYDITGGLVNVAMGPVLTIWHDYRENGVADTENAKLPPMELLKEAAALTDIRDVVIDEEQGTVFLRKPGMSLDVGAVAKAFAAGLAAEDAKEAGLTSALIDAGGNVVSIGKPLDGVRDRWGVGIQNPDLTVRNTQNILDTVYLNDAVVACSGGYQRFYYVDGEIYNHIIDPRTLMPARLYKQVAVIHANAAMSDLLSTALFALSYEEGASLAAKHGAEALWMDWDDTYKQTDGYARVSKTFGNYSAVN